jgi:hypothetical protein
VMMMFVVVMLIIMGDDDAGEHVIVVALVMVNMMVMKVMVSQLILTICHSRITTTRCKTTTFQKSYLNRCTRMWNVLPKNLTGNNTRHSQFKNGLFMYYKVALETVYTTWMIQEHGNQYVCPVTSPVICPVKYRVVISLMCL